MKIGLVLSSILIIAFSSCQQEVDTDILQRTTNDSSTTFMLKIVEHDYTSSMNDSIIRILNKVIVNGEQHFVLSEVYSDQIDDTTFYIFTYNSQNRLNNIKEIS